MLKLKVVRGAVGTVTSLSFDCVSSTWLLTSLATQLPSNNWSPVAVYNPYYVYGSGVPRSDAPKNVKRYGTALNKTPIPSSSPTLPCQFIDAELNMQGLAIEYRCIEMRRRSCLIHSGPI